MEWAIMTFGGKLCCIFASGCGGVANVLTKKKWNLGAVKDILSCSSCGLDRSRISNSGSYGIL